MTSYGFTPESLPRELRVFYDWRVKDLHEAAVMKLNAVLFNECSSFPHILTILNIVGGCNFLKIKSFLEKNPEWSYDSPQKIDIPKLNISLNPEQVEATVHDTRDEPLLILAGAGSGKTAVLTRRIAMLMILGIDPSSIMAVTFTNKAAAEMKERVIHLIDDITEGIEDAEFTRFIDGVKKNLDALAIGTFHSICYSLITEIVDGEYNYKRLGFSSFPSILSTGKQQAIINELLEEHGIKTASAFDVLEELNNAKNELIPPENFEELGKTTVMDKKQFLKVYTGYQKYLSENNIVDFDDIILKTSVLLAKFENVTEYYQTKYQYFLIDEYQDTNFAQYVMAIIMTKKYKNIFAVGDDDQSIYGWRGADIRNILNFKKDFPNANIIKFEKNYRSSDIILMAANSIFMDKDEEMRKNLKFSSGSKIAGWEKQIIIYEALSETDEAEFVANEIKTYTDFMQVNMLKELNDLFSGFETSFYNCFYEAQRKYQTTARHSAMGWEIFANLLNQFNELSAKKTLPNFLKFKDYFDILHFSLYESITAEEKIIFEELINHISGHIDKLQEKLYVYNNFAIFYRINSQKDIFKKVLDEQKLPYIEVGDNKFFDSLDIINLIAMFTLFNGVRKFVEGIEEINISAEINQPLAEIMKIPKFQMLENEIRLFENQAPEICVLEENEYNYLTSNLCDASKKTFYIFIQELYGLIGEAQKKHMPVAELVNYFSVLLGYDKLMESGNEKGRVIKRNFEQFMKISFDFEKVNKTAGIKYIDNFLNFLKYKSGDVQDEAVKKDGIYLMTLHSSKGLEFNYVFFTGLEDGVCPHKFMGKKISKEEFDEEKRLFYVGVTRAKKKLILSYCHFRKWGNKVKSQRVSEFLKLIPKEIKESVSKINFSKRFKLKIKKLIQKIKD